MRLIVALCRDYGLEPFREAGRRYSTVQVRAPKSFRDPTIWPEFIAPSEEFDAHLEELMTRVIRETINDDGSEQTGEPRALPEPGE